MAEAAKRDEVLLVEALFVVLGERRDVVNRQAAVNEQAARKANPTAVLIPFENSASRAFPKLSIAEFIGLRSSRNVVVERLAAMPRVNATADRAKTFYLKFHTTIIAYLFGTFGTSFLEEAIIRFFNALLGIPAADFSRNSAPTHKAHTAVINDLSRQAVGNVADKIKGIVALLTDFFAFRGNEPFEVNAALRKRTDFIGNSRSAACVR